MNTNKIISTALSRVGDEKRLKSYLESQSKIVERDYFYQLDYFVDELLLVVEREIKSENSVLKKRTDILNAEIARLEANTDNFLIYPSCTSKSWSDMSESERNQSKEDERIRLINKNKEILNKETESLTKKINRLETLKRAINSLLVDDGVQIDDSIQENISKKGPYSDTFYIKASDAKHFALTHFFEVQAKIIETDFKGKEKYQSKFESHWNKRISELKNKHDAPNLSVGSTIRKAYDDVWRYSISDFNNISLNDDYGEDWKQKVLAITKNKKRLKEYLDKINL